MNKPVSVGVVAVVRGALVEKHIYRVPLTYEQISDITGVIVPVVRLALAELRAARDPFGLFHTCDKARDFNRD